MRISSPSEKIHAEIEAPIGWIVVDNPARRNAVDLAMWLAIPALVEALVADDRVRVIMLRGGGEQAFVAGADISEFETVRATAESARGYEASNADAFAALRHAAKPTIAMIRGFCLGGGLGLAVACDMRLSSDDAVFGIPAGRLGVGYPPEAVRDVVNLVGPSRAKDIFFTARRLDHAEAYRIGLVDRLFPAADLFEETRKLAETIAANAPLTLKAAKAAITGVAGDPLAADWAAIKALADACFDSDDYAEGRAAFLEKRSPVFRGR
ncbi:MAG: enoyl-CoA hydratase [Hyphomicrobiales bacterium]